MEPGGSLPRSQALAAGPYPEPDQYCPCPPSYLLKINFNIILWSRPKFTSGLFPPSSVQLTSLLNLDALYLACGCILQTGYLRPSSCNPANLKQNTLQPMADQKAIIERHPFDLLALLSLIHKYSYGIHKVSTHVTDIVTQILSNCDDAESNT